MHGGRSMWVVDALRCTARSGLALLLAVAGITGEACAQAPDMAQAAPPAVLHPGAVELGIAGTLITVEGITTGAVVVRGGLFRTAAAGLGGVELAASYRHVSSLDEAGIEGMITWQRRLGTSATYPFVALAGGWRHEEIGSFGQSRYPAGFGIGARSLLGQRSALRVEYQFRRVLGDPIADFSEHQIIVGLSVFFRNSPASAVE
ncbi:MAG: hypothetical protein ACE5EO_04725 [Candidatus Krumholzibacteriia bacterium]